MGALADIHKILTNPPPAPPNIGGRSGERRHKGTGVGHDECDGRPKARRVGTGGTVGKCKCNT
jgi:hypothetical protein